jgi:hypothetical protein
MDATILKASWSNALEAHFPLFCFLVVALPLLCWLTVKFWSSIMSAIQKNAPAERLVSRNLDANGIPVFFDQDTCYFDGSAPTPHKCSVQTGCANSISAAGSKRAVWLSRKKPS